MARKVFSLILDFAQTILLAFSVFLVIYMFLFRPFQVSGESMFPNFEDKEYVLTNLIGMQFSPLKKGDVIVFKAPPDPDKDYIKRVIGLSGDTVMVKDGKVYVNGQLVNESPFLSSNVPTNPGAFLQEGQTVTVPDGEYFVMGDNRDHSSDSRAWGFVKRSEVIGRSMFVYWPFNQMRSVKNPYSN